ncbi:MAG: hypothetical protein EOM37_05205 [Proteobacteria bacterium]|jgi:hypothetical protein|nr:hypothetical protein [Alphaproteobacteria bacterium]NCC03430.1 hypothetical protein [Pseudomonadota bacterium]
MTDIFSSFRFHNLRHHDTVLGPLNEKDTPDTTLPTGMMAHIADLFVHDMGAIHVPFASDVLPLRHYSRNSKAVVLDPSLVDYDFERARLVDLRHYREEKDHLVITPEALSLSRRLPNEPGLYDHLMFLRFKDKLERMPREKAEILLNDLSFRGYKLPPVILGNDLDFERCRTGRAVMMRVPDMGWRSFYVRKAEYALPNESMLKLFETATVIFIDQTTHFQADLNRACGVKSFNRPVSDDHRRALFHYYVNAALCCNQTNGGALRILFPDGSLPFAANTLTAQFSLAGIVTTQHPKEIGAARGILLSHPLSGEAKTACGLSRRCTFIPIQQSRKNDGILHTELLAHEARALTLSVEHDMLDITPAPLPEAAREALVAQLPNSPPSWHHPIRVRVVG